jgi:membrane associated rhomboid family serine protease
MYFLVLLLIALNVIVSLAGFNNRAFFQRYVFSVRGILKEHQYERIPVSTFLHVDYIHLFFNMFSFYSFAIHIERQFGSLFLFLLFFGSAFGGDLLALLIHRNHPRYTAAGASGAISGVIFASVLLLPGGSILIFPFPFGIPPWLFAIIFVLFSVYGIGKQSGNIGHEAHLGGALTGVLITALVYPAIVAGQIFLTIVLVVPVLVFLIIFFRDPKKLKLKRQNRYRQG